MADCRTLPCFADGTGVTVDPVVYRVLPFDAAPPRRGLACMVEDGDEEEVEEDGNADKHVPWCVGEHVRRDDGHQGRAYGGKAFPWCGFRVECGDAHSGVWVAHVLPPVEHVGDAHDGHEPCHRVQWLEGERVEVHGREGAGQGDPP